MSRLRRIIDIRSVNGRAKKILVERALTSPCRETLLARLESPHSNTRLEALLTLKYIFDFKHKSRSLITLTMDIRLMADLHDNKAMLQVLSFALSHYRSLLLCLNNSIDSPEATRLTIQNLTFLMRMQKQFRMHFACNILFGEWIEDPRNPLYQLQTVEGLLVCSQDPYAEDIFIPEVQQFIYYIGESSWHLPSDLDSRVIERFQRIWRVETDRTPVVPFPDPGERWFSDRESERSEDENGYEDDYYESYSEFLNSMGNGDDEGEGSVDFIDDEPDVPTPEDIMRYFHVAEEAGLRSQDRRRGGRRVVGQYPPMQV
jgi:hypothetical protein